MAIDVVKFLTISPVVNSNGASHETTLYDLKVFNSGYHLFSRCESPITGFVSESGMYDLVTPILIP